jgi:hypothetical protein
MFSSIVSKSEAIIIKKSKLVIFHYFEPDGKQDFAKQL